MTTSISKQRLIERPNFFSPKNEKRKKNSGAEIRFFSKKNSNHFNLRLFVFSLESIYLGFLDVEKYKTPIPFFFTGSDNDEKIKALVEKKL